MSVVQITNGSYLNQEVTGIFPVVSEMKQNKNGGYFITVDASETEFKRAKIRVKVKPENVEVISEHAETDEEVMDRIAERFEILDEMTGATLDGIVRGMVVSGPPGVGKTYGIEQVIEKDLSLTLWQSVLCVTHSSKVQCHLSVCMLRSTSILILSQLLFLTIVIASCSTRMH